MSKDQEKDALQNSVAPVDDNELADVSGGWTNIFNCPREHSKVLCELTFCPHIKSRDNTPDEKHYDKYCDLGYWTINEHYQEKY